MSGAVKGLVGLITAEHLIDDLQSPGGKLPGRLLGTGPAEGQGQGGQDLALIAALKGQEEADRIARQIVIR